MTITLQELNQEAKRTLFKELGPAKSQRFLNQFSLGNGNYVDEKDRVFSDITLDQLWTAMEEKTD